jgi:hypothetical protein
MAQFDVVPGGWWDQVLHNAPTAHPMLTCPPIPTRVSPVLPVVAAGPIAAGATDNQHITAIEKHQRKGGLDIYTCVLHSGRTISIADGDVRWNIPENKQIR